MSPDASIRVRCLELALRVPDIRPNAVHIVAAVFERFVVHGATNPVCADRGDAPAA